MLLSLIHSFIYSSFQFRSSRFILCRGDCPQGRLGENDLGKSLELQVNGRKVEKMHKMGDNCYLLEGQKKYFGAKNDGSYHLQVNVKKQSDEYVSYFDVTTVAVM